MILSGVKGMRDGHRCVDIEKNDVVFSIITHYLVIEGQMYAFLVIMALKNRKDRVIS